MTIRGEHQQVCCECVWLHAQGLTTDGAGTLMAGDADRRVLDIVDPGRRQAAVKVAGRALLGADSDEGAAFRV
jgi:hypothetical protein